MSQEDLKAEIANPVEPLLPIEKKLIAWSFGTGVVLLAILLLLGHFFPVSWRALVASARRPAAGARQSAGFSRAS